MKQVHRSTKEYLLGPSLCKTLAANHLALSPTAERLVWHTVLPPFSERTKAKATGRLRFCFGLACVYHSILQTLPSPHAKRLCHALAHNNRVLGGMHKGLRAGYGGTLFYNRRHGFWLAMAELGAPVTRSCVGGMVMSMQQAIDPDERCGVLVFPVPVPCLVDLVTGE